ncbi:MAG: hypothetical protein MUF48_24485 [Pirellulaceae bacterium]|nr:hypothetical protein [Pirellulaceae bacterium]
MKRLLMASLLVGMLSLTGCQWLTNLLITNIAGDSDKPPERRAGWSDERYAYALEEHRRSEIARDMMERENQLHMQEFGYPKYPHVYCPPPED